MWVIRLGFIIATLAQCGGQRTTADLQTLHSLDSDCENKGFTARSVLGRYPAHVVAFLGYRGLVNVPATKAAIDFAYEGGKIVCTPSYLPQDGSRYVLPASISIDTTVRLTTDDGLLAETLTGTLLGWYRGSGPGVRGD